MLGKHSGQDEVVVGIPYANRDESAVQDVVGYFVNTLAVRVPLEVGAGGFRDVLKVANDRVNSAVEHAVVPFVKVVEVVAPERDASRTPLFQTMLTWEEATGWGEIGEGFTGLESCGDGDETGDVTKFEIELQLAGTSSSGLDGGIVYNTDLYDSATIAAVSKHFVTLLDLMVESSDTPLHKLSCMDGEEMQLVVETWNETSQPHPSDATCHELFEAQAERAPMRWH